MKTLKLSMAAMLALMTAAGASAAADGPVAPAGGHSLAAFIGGYDANRDGVVTREEYDTVRKQRFMTADVNRDGWLSEDEYVAEFEGRLKQQYAGRAPDESYANSIKQAHVRFKILDTDHDGKLTVAEENAIADKTFRNNDTNGDGKVDKADKADGAKS
ncbi:EF-hand domain-containing protein [Oxalobacteraceae bacterium A2-2]